MSRAWPPPGSAGCARKRVEIEGTARRFAWARPSPGSMGKGRGVVLAVGMDGATVRGIRSPGGGVQKKRCRAGRAADRAKRECTAPPPVQAAKKVALSLPPGGTNGCRKSGARHPMAGGWVKKEVRPGGRKMWEREGTARRFAWAGTGARHPFPGRRRREGQKGTAALRAVPPLENPVGSRLRRAHREAPPRRPCKTPQKAASDEPNGKHRLGDSAKPRRKPSQTSPTGSIASATLQNPAEGRLGRAQREASPWRHWKNPRGKPPQTSPSASIAAATLQKPAKSPPQTRPSGNIAAATVRGIVGRAAG